jgi:hypothetical protein
MIAALLLSIFSFLFYLTTLSGTVPAYRDSGDLINAVHTLGIAHPPGYPVYVFVSHLFEILLPFGNPAYRVNVFSAGCAAISVGLLYLLVSPLPPATKTLAGIRQRLNGGRGEGEGEGKQPLLFPAVAVGAAILYALSPAVVALARVAEMYTLAACIAAAILLCYAIGTERSLQLGGFLLGIGFGVHPTLIFLAPLLIPWPAPAKEIVRRALPRCAFFALGFSCVLMLLVRARTGPVQNWGCLLYTLTLPTKA